MGIHISESGRTGRSMELESVIINMKIKVYQTIISECGKTALMRVLVEWFIILEDIIKENGDLIYKMGKENT